ncbi:MAG: hypothetical protein KDB07_03925 [Planctomycetes bacterium]|nr:hypothetical protein [Planctomycetota bacterium]
MAHVAFVDDFVPGWVDFDGSLFVEPEFIFDCLEFVPGDSIEAVVPHDFDMDHGAYTWHYCE